MGVIRVRASRRAKAHTRRSSLRVVKAQKHLVSKIWQHGMSSSPSARAKVVNRAMETLAKKRLIGDIIFSRSSMKYYHGQLPGQMGLLNKRLKSRNNY